MELCAYGRSSALILIPWVVVLVFGGSQWFPVSEPARVSLLGGWVLGSGNTGCINYFEMEAGLAEGSYDEFCQ